VSRTHRFLGGLSLGYVHLGVVTVVGLWLTPFLLARVGTHDLGLWLVTTQILGYLALLDFGVVALAPRETAYATGRAQHGTSSTDVAETLGRFRKVVGWQTAPVALVCAGAWWVVRAQWPELGGPLAIILTAFVVAFPFRLYHAALQGLQDLAFLGKVQLASWLSSTLVTIVLVLAGAGLHALAAGWVVLQATSAIACGLRIRMRFSHYWAGPRPAMGWTAARALLSRSGWISVAQVGQIFLNGSDILVIGAVFGPAAAVPYACTAKLISVLGNHPQLLMQTAAPALAEMRTSATRARLADVAAALTGSMMVLSGAVGCVVLAVNGAFVSWWVGPSQYAGGALTGVLVTAMLLRHWSTTLTYTLFAFGHERRISLTAIGDGCVTLVVTAALAAWTPLGLVSAAIGSAAGVLLVSLPWSARAAARDLGIGVGQLIGSLGGWAMRFAVAVGLAVVVERAAAPSGLPATAAVALAAAGIYAVAMLPLLTRPPLVTYLRAALEPLTRFRAGRARPRDAGPPASAGPVTSHTRP
jgi:O-antigen/teichoic acid export membrane protein